MHHRNFERKSHSSVTTLRTRSVETVLSRDLCSKVGSTVKPQRGLDSHQPRLGDSQAMEPRYLNCRNYLNPNELQVKRAAWLKQYLANTCHEFYYISCLVPLLEKVPKKVANCEWHCADYCDNSDEEGFEEPAECSSDEITSRGLRQRNETAKAQRPAAAEQRTKEISELKRLSSHYKYCRLQSTSALLASLLIDLPRTRKTQIKTSQWRESKWIRSVRFANSGSTTKNAFSGVRARSFLGGHSQNFFVFLRMSVLTFYTKQRGNQENYLASFL
ncbi:unnamed protein product [Cylicocyclus nassatus]|uniref:Uncharacterized protein n=1 Tax=Cylicocyclus nassatus TaxID=53992 RepID=A0AA36H6D9_CYLNA|nr:unnamed protein product [Cylicocyclus nassatus]